MKALIKKINRILKDRRTRRLITRIVSVSAALVVFVTTYALVLPAITMEAEAQCGIEAHQHDDSCYEDVLVCGQEESEGHTHDESCYSISQELICEIPEHQHDETCYDEDGNLQCQMQEHEHTDDCYKEVRELTCTLEESEGHHHTDACYEKNLICGKEVHTHSPDCYEKEAADAVAASTGYTAGTDSSIVAEEIDHATVENQGTEESAAAATTNVLLPEDLQSEDLSDGYVPQLDSLYFDAVLNNHTAFYYFHPEEGEEVPANSADITSWKPVDKDTELAPTDLVKAYLAYTIPAGSLNETNQIARYRLPANIHLTDDQIIAINNNENGIAAGYVDPSTNTVLDEDADNYHKYLGAEAVEGTRRPDQDSRNAGEDGFGDTAQEYISATVKAENVFDEEGLYGEKGAYLGQDLIFVFSPYTIEKNQTTYDTAGNPTAKGEKVTGWFAVDLNMEQIDWVEDETREEQIGQVTEEPASEQADQIGEEPVSDQTDQSAEETAPDQIDQSTDEVGQSENTNKTINIVRTTIVKSAEIIFAEKNKDVKASEISRRLKLVEYTEREEEADAATTSSDEVTEADTAAAAEDAVDETVDEGSVEDQVPDDAADADSTTKEEQASEGVTSDDKDQEAEDKDKEKQEPEYKDGSLTSEGDDYKITLDYTAEAKIPAEAVLSVREITAETDPEVYQACLDQASAHTSTGDSTIDQQASRFFDIEIVVKDEEGQQQKIEPEAPVSVNIQLPEKKDTDKDQARKDNNSKDKGSNSKETKNEDSKGSASQDGGSSAKNAASTQDPTVLHFAEKGVEQVEAETSVNETKKDTATEVQFQAESFSIYGVIYTVDFKYEVDGKMYQFSLPGGGFVSFTDLIEVLGIISDTNSEKNSAAIDAATQTVDGTLDVAVSEAAKKFVADVASVEFSSPELVDVSKVENQTTVGQIKERRGLECEYSAELTEEQITEINAQTVKSGDWALITVQPFTSEESMTVTLKDGEVFTIRVTDAQIKKTVIDAKGDTWEITVTYDEDAQIPDGAELNVHEIIESDKRYLSYLVSSIDAMGCEGGVPFARFFDIEIMKGEEKIEPKTPVKVEIAYKDELKMDADDELHVVHFASDGIEDIDDVSISENGGTLITYEQSSFSVTGTLINGNNPQNNQDYVVILKKNNKYYVVLNDGSLEEINLNGNSFMMDHPMVWKYQGDHISHKAFARTLDDGLKTASSWYYKYLDPSLEEGISNPTVGQIYFNSETPNEQLNIIDAENNAKRNQASLQFTGGKLRSTSAGNTNYYLGVDESTMHVIGKANVNEAAEVYFARADVNYNMSGNNGNRYANSCNHIDISVEAIAGVDVPLAYGDYYDEAGNLILSVSRENPVILKLSKKVDVTEDDIKNADLEAFIKDNEGGQTEVNNAYYVTGYSGNAPVEGSTAQVRVEGVFKVADWNQWDGDNALWTGDVPRNHRIYYSLSTVKTETFELKYNGISLYRSKDTAEPNREPLSITTDVTLSTSFDYWDEDNECPGIMEGWIPGGTPTQRWRDGWINATNLDGMDFVLGSQSESEPGVVAVEITKLIVDTDGNLISTTKETKNEMEIYLDRDGDPNTVKDLDVNRYTTPADYNGYVHVHDRTITVGQQGLGSIYDYAVDPGMIYIKEKPGSIEQELTDINDDKWVYHSTRIETEYVWRNNDGGVHVSDTYRVNGQNSSYASIPEVLGGYEFDGCTSPNYAANDGVQPYNGFLEFYVYNVYAPEDTDLTVSKIWKKGDTDIAAPADAEVKVFLKRYKLVPDEVYYDKGRLYIDKAFSGAEQDGFAAIYTVTNGERTWQLSYNDLPKTLTDLDPGTYTITEAVASDGAPAGFEAYHSDPVTVEVKGGQTATASFLTRYARSNTGRPATVQIYNDQYSHDVKYSNSVSYYAGDVLQISWVRSYNATIRYRVNNGEWVSMEKYPDNSGPEQRTDTFTVSIPENGILNIELDDSWTSIHNIEVTKAGGANRLSVRRLVGKAPVKAGSAVNTASFTNSNEAPVSNTSGMKYVVDESWPNVSSEYEYERNLAQNGIVLNNGHWSDDSLTGLPAYDANGRYIYAIDHIEETNLLEGTQVLFGKAEGSDLTVENHLPRDLSVTKAWNDGENQIPWPEDGPESIEIQLTRSTDGVNFEPAVNTQGITFTPVAITAADPVATFESLPYMDGNGKAYQYKASEVTIPDGYRPVTTTDSDGNVTITNTRMAVTVIKVDENNQPLPGAGFTLYKNTVDDAGKIEEKVADYRTTQFIFKNLTDGNYILHETTAPTGYSALAEDIRFTVSEKNIIVNNKPDNVLWDENSFVLTVKNMPLEGSLSVRKQWLDFFGNATEYDGTIDLKLVQWVPGEPKQHTVTFIVQCVGDGAVDGHGDVEFEGQVYELARRSGTGVGDVSLHWSWDQYTEDREVDVSGLQNSSYVQVSANGTQGKGGRTVTVTNIDRDLTVYIVIPNGGWKGTADNLIDDQPVFNGNHPHEGDLTATGGTKTVTLGQNDIWTAQFNVSGDGLLSDASTTLPATYSQSGTAKPCYYSIAEEQIPEGYTLTQISTGKVQEGVLTAYNKKTSVDVTVVKTDKNRPAERLNGATFVLRQIDPAATGNMDTRMLAGGKSDTSTTAGEGAAKGTLTFPDLENGIYEIKETIAPDGYIMSGDSAFYIRVSAEGIALLQKDETTAAETWRTILNSSELSLQNEKITVTNEPGAALPHTGGPGTRIFTILGSILILGAGALLWRRRRLI